VFILADFFFRTMRERPKKKLKQHASEIIVKKGLGKSFSE
jgi:hypothetical protein